MITSRSLSFVSPRRWLQTNSQFALRVLIVAAVLAGSYYLGPRASQRYLILLIVAFVAPVAVQALARQPAWGPLALIVASLLVPFAIGTGTQTSLNATVLLLAFLTGLWLFDMLARQRVIRLVSSPPIRPLLLFAAVVMLAYLAGQLPWFPMVSPASQRSQLGGLAIFMLSASAFLLVAHQIREIIWLQRLMWLFLSLGGIYIAGRALPMLGHYTGRLFQQGTNGSIFWVWLVALAFGQAVFNRRLGRRWRLALGLLVVTTFYVSLFQARSWASGWLPSLVAVVFTLLAGAPRLGLFTALASGALAVTRSQQIIALIMVNEQYSALTRFEALRILAEMVKTSPVLGFGPSNYHWYVSQFPILGYYVQFNSHNQYMDIVAQTGLLGLASFIWFVWSVGRLAWRLRTRVPEGFAQAYVYGALGGLAGTLAAGTLADWVLPFVYNVGLAGLSHSMFAWLFLGGLVSLQQLYGNGQEETSS